MPKHRFNFRLFVITVFILCLSLFAACKDPMDGDTKPEPEKPNTFVKFTNLEQFKVTVYSDSLRQRVFTEVAALGSVVVAAVSSASGTVFYPTFHLDLFDIPGVSVPYNAPGVVTTAITENSTTDVPIPKLESIDITSAFIKIINNSSVPLTLRQGSSEINLLVASSGIIAANQKGVYEVTPGPCSGYSLMRNTVTQIDFPADISEFRRGMIYVFTYNGTSLTLTETKSVLRVPMSPGNVRVSAVTASSVSLTWNAVSGASGYNVYHSASETGTYNKINKVAITGTEFTDTDLSAYSTYWYKVSAIVNTVEGLQSNPVSASTGIEVQGSGLAAKLAWLQANAVSNSLYTVEVNTDESISPTTLSYSNRINITITLTGVSSTRIVGLSSSGSMFTVSSGVTLVLDNNITLQGRSGNNNALVRVNSGGILVMNEGSAVTGNTGGGVSVYQGTFNMNGGTISGNTYSYGGGVYVSGGTFTMSGGTISGNTATNDNGGGVYVSSGTFTMSDGTVSGNTASSHGGGAYVSSGTFTINGGTVSSNTATNGNGGGMFVAASGTFTMNSGTVSGNTTTNGNGGGVYVNSGTFTMSDGTVSGNTASSYGGGVYVSQGTFTKTEGTIYGYSVGDANSNVVKNNSGTVLNDQGHAAYAYGSINAIKHKETAAGPGVNLSWNYNGGSPIFSGGWDSDPLGMETNPIALTAGTWTDGNIALTASGSAVWYLFTVTGGTVYYVWWNDSNQGNNTKTLNVKVSAYYSNGTSIFTGIDSGWSSPRQFTAGSSGTVKVKVEPYTSGRTGTFSVGYSTGSTRPDGVTPSIPTGVTATAASSSSITVSWASVSEATGYYVYRSTSASGTYSLLGSSTPASYSDTGLSASTTYYYKVSAYNSYGESAQSSYASKTTTPGTPTGVTATAVSFSITVSWPSAAGATSYYIYRSTSASGTYSQIGSSTSTSYTNTGLSAGTTYYYKVAAYNGSVTGAQSDYAYATTSATAPGTPTGVTATAASPNSIALRWSSVSGATGYYIYRSTSASGTYSQIGSWTTTSVSNNGLSAGTTYYYKISAYNSYGESVQSSYVSATTPNPTPLTLATWANGSITSTASAVWYSFSVTSGTSYSVWWNDSYSGNGTKTLDIMVSAYYSNGTEIFYYEDSGWSSPWSFTASSTGTVNIKVEPYTSGSTGTFAVAYRARSNTRP